MGSGDLRHVVLQPGPDILPHVRDRGMPGRIVFRGREGSKDVPEKDERSGKEC
jgi:hypothetical protein